MGEIESLNYLKERVSSCSTCELPTVGVICGSGLSGLVNALDDALAVKYEDIPGFPSTTIAGHTGELVFGRVGNVHVVCMRGRFHSYEGHEMTKVTMPVRLMRGLGVETLIVTNAAGGVNRSFNVGDLMIITDHIGFPLLAGKNPLVGPNDETYGGARFVGMSSAYDKALQALTYETAQKLGYADFVQRRGTYMFVSGPQYETSAESKMIMMLGGDSVGMSTVPEVSQAIHCGMKVIGLSLITNAVVLPGDTGPIATHDEVLETVAMRSEQIQNLVRTLIPSLEKSKLEAEEARLVQATLDSESAARAKSGGNLEERIKALDLSNMTPLQALNELHELKKLV